MKALSPIEIPELLLLIANYLEQRHVVACLEVCRSWNELLLPLIWKSVAIGDRLSRNSLEGPSHGNLEHHSHYVFKLKIFYPYPLEHYTLAFPNLHTLKLTYNARRHYSLHQFHAIQLITLNTSLVYLSITTYCMRETDVQFWKAVSGLPRLKRLRAKIDLGSSEMDVFWNVCSKLEDIHLVEAHFPKNEIQLAEWSFSRMRKLVFAYNPGVTHSEELEIICRCKNLEDLEWHTSSDNNIYDAFANAIDQGSLPRLERLKIHCSKQPVTDKNSERIIRSMQQIIKLSLRRSEFGLLSFRALRRHFSVLVDLDLRFRPIVTSTMLLELLCSCPRLEKLQGDSIQAKDAVEGRAWVCLSMKGLKVSFRFEESEQSLQPLIFRRLSSLVLIENFDIRDFYTDGEGIRRLDMRLTSGLEQLSQWKNFKSLNVSGSMQSMEETDVRWAITNWTRLDAFYGALNEDKDMGQRLKYMIKARGIKC